jgi:hypothetical protein
MNDVQIIGSGVTVGGVAFLLLGIFTFLNRRFLVTANVLLLLGLLLLYGTGPFFRFLFQKDKLKGTFGFVLGISMIFLKWTLPGVAFEVVGLYWLFGGFLPLFFSLLSRIPIIGLFVPSSMKKQEDLGI